MSTSHGETEGLGIGDNSAAADGSAHESGVCTRSSRAGAKCNVRKAGVEGNWGSLFRGYVRQYSTNSWK